MNIIRKAEQAILDDISVMMSEFVDNWPEPKKIDTAIALIAKTLRAALDPPPHKFWGAGEADCPNDIKAGNGEFHTLRCKVCGADNPRDNRCLVRSLATDTTPSRDEEGSVDREATLEEAAQIMDARAAMYRAKAERHDPLAPDSLTEHERFISNAEASEWGAAAIRAIRPIRC